MVPGAQTTQAAQATPGIAVPQSLVYFGTQTSTGPKSRGIYAYRFDANKVKVEFLRMMAEMKNPTWIIEHPSHKVLYAVNDLGNDMAGLIFSYKIDPRTGSLTLMNQVSAGAIICVCYPRVAGILLSLAKNSL